MRDVTIRQLAKEEQAEFMAAMQQAFQDGFEAHFGKTQDCILPQQDIEASLSKKGVQAYGLWTQGRLAGGAVVVMEPESELGFLDFLFVCSSEQSKGIGWTLWQEVCRNHPHVRLWETATPYFDVRNIHFYVNKCGFHIVEFFHAHHPDPGQSESFVGDGGQGMFLLRKTMTA